MKGAADIISLILGFGAFLLVIILRIYKYGFSELLISSIDLAYKSLLTFIVVSILSKIILGIIFKNMRKIEEETKKSTENEEPKEEAKN